MSLAPRRIRLPITLGFAALVGSCGSDLDGDGGGGAPPSDLGPDRSDDTLTEGAFTAQRLSGASRFQSLIQVELVINNLPDFAGTVGESVVVRGTGIFLDDASPAFDWSSDQVRGVIQSDRSATIVFYQDLTAGGQSRTDFKVFRDASTTPVLIDRTTTTPGSEGNIQLELLSIARRGDSVRVTVDARDPSARASVPTLVTGIAQVETVSGTRSDFDDLIEVELRLTNIPEAIGSVLIGIGETLVVRGENIYPDGFADPQTWDGDNVSGRVQRDRSARIKFYQSLSRGGEQRTTNFKVFQVGTWNEVVVDNDERDGNIRLDLLQIASLGARVVVTVDLSNPLAIPPIGDVVDGPISARALEGRSPLPNWIQVELVLRNLPEAAGAAGERLSIRGQGLYIDENNGFDWMGDRIAAEIAASRTATASFFIEGPTLAFKVYWPQSDVEIVVDQDNPNESRIEPSISAIARRGTRVQVLLDTADQRLRTEVGPYRVRLDPAGNSGRCPELLEVSLQIDNLADFAGRGGDRVVVRGNRIFVDDRTSFTWDSDALGGPILGTSRAAQVEFCQDLSDPSVQSETDFGVYRDQTWTRVLQDATVENGNIQLDLNRVGGPGERVIVRVDGAHATARPPPPSFDRGPFDGRFISSGENELCPNLLEISLLLQSIPEAVAPPGTGVVVRGAGIFRNDTEEAEDDDIEATVEGTPGSARLTFCQTFDPTEAPQTAFRVYRRGSSEVVAQNTEAPDGIIRLPVSDLGFEGTRVEVVLDVSDPQVGAPPE